MVLLDIEISINREPTDDLVQVLEEVATEDIERAKLDFYDQFAARLRVALPRRSGRLVQSIKSDQFGISMLAYGAQFRSIFDAVYNSMPNPQNVPNIIRYD